MFAVWVERLYPTVVAALITVAIVIWADPKAVMKEMLPLVSDMTAIFIGFLGTLAAILLSSNSRAIRFMKQIGHFDGIIKYLWNAMRWLFAFLGLSLALNVIGMDGEKAGPLPESLSVAWLFIGSLSLAMTFRGLDVATQLIFSIAQRPD